MKKNTFYGFLAILLWSTNVAFARSLAEKLGVFTSGMLTFLLGGLLSLIVVFVSQRSLVIINKASPKYLLGCGLLFLVNTISLQVGTGLAETHTQVLIVVVLNYLWTVLSLVFSIWILGKKARWFLWLGFAFAIAGMWLALSQGEHLKISEIFTSGRTILVYVLAIMAAITWGLYSNFSRKWAGEQSSGAVPLFLLGSGLVMVVLRAFIPEQTIVTTVSILELGYMVIFPTILAYVFWDAAMRKGKMVLVISFSYLIPVLSTLISSIKLGISFNPSIFIAAGLTMAGAIICRLAIKD